MARLARGYPRPGLFNWISILLVTAWVALVGVIAANAPNSAPAEDVETFVGSLVK